MDSNLTQDFWDFIVYWSASKYNLSIK